MLDFSFDATVTCNWLGQTTSRSLAGALTIASILISNDRPFSIKSPQEGDVYATYDGNTLYCDSRVEKVLTELGEVQLEESE